MFITNEAVQVINEGTYREPNKEKVLAAHLDF